MKPLMKIPFETERLILRKFTKKDIDEYFKIAQDDKIQKYVPYMYPISIEDVSSSLFTFFINCDFYHDFCLAIEEKSSHKLIGALNITEDIHGFEHDVSMFIGKEFRRKNFMSEALISFCNLWPHQKNLRFTINRNNKASILTVSKIPGVLKVSNEDDYWIEFIF